MRNYRIFSKTSLSTLAFVSAVSLGIAAFTPKSAQADMVCSENLKQRTPEQVIQEHVALIQAGNIPQAMCDYHEDAVVILPGFSTTGLQNIQQALEGFAQLFGGAPPVVDTLTTSGPVVLLTFHVTGPELSIPNGADTYVVDKGKILYQTVHDEIVPTPTN